MENINSTSLQYIKNVVEKPDFNSVTWDELHLAIDVINGIGKEVNLTIFKTYTSLTVEAGGKFVKNYAYANAEYVTSEQSSKEATFKLINDFYLKNIEKYLVES